MYNDNKMDPIFKKLNFKSQEQILILNAPDSFRINIDAISDLTTIVEDINDVDSVTFAISFATKQSEVDAFATSVLDKAASDATIWFAYPKKSSKNYNCEFNRDTGWEILGQYGYEGVRMVAIDQDWSALRFRQVGHIKKITRRKSMALTKEAKRRTINKN